MNITATFYISLKNASYLKVLGILIDFISFLMGLYKLSCIHTLSFVCDAKRGADRNKFLGLETLYSEIHSIYLSFIGF